MSAHAYPQFKQDCKECSRSFLPVALWVNLEARDDEAERPSDDNKPHHRDKCEACRLGVCDAGKEKY